MAFDYETAIKPTRRIEKEKRMMHLLGVALRHSLYPWRVGDIEMYRYDAYDVMFDHAQIEVKVVLTGLMLPIRANISLIDLMNDDELAVLGQIIEQVYDGFVTWQNADIPYNVELGEN